MYVTHNCYILIRGNTLGEITEEALHYAYFYLTRSLLEHRAQGDNNGEFEAFALEVLAPLQKHRHLYTTPIDAPSPPTEY